MVDREGTVVRITESGDTVDFQAKVKLHGFKLIGNATDASTAVVRDTDSSGLILWQGRCAQNADLFEQINIRADKKIHITLTGTGPILYVYLE